MLILLISETGNRTSVDYNIDYNIDELTFVLKLYVFHVDSKLNNVSHFCALIVIEHRILCCPAGTYTMCLLSQ